jgi:UDP-N-acetylmuramate dehydrogenase
MYRNIPECIGYNIALHDKNWFCTGGRAAFFCAPQTLDEFKQVLQWSNEEGVTVHILGQGANTLISDEGFDGLVIRPMLGDIHIEDSNDNECLVTAGSGVSMPDLIVYCLEHSIIGLEEFAGIPGTVGGSTYNNLHYFEYSLADFLVSASVIDRSTGVTSKVDKDWLSLGYDHSVLHAKQHYLVAATFKLRRVSPLEAAYAQGRRVEIIRHRDKRYPTRNTCGSFFRNFHEEEIERVRGGKKLTYVAYYLDNVGVKGSLRIGNACVSHQHANMIVTLDNATSADVIAVARTMQEKVWSTFGIIPQPECELVGFKTYPLL